MENIIIICSRNDFDIKWARFVQNELSKKGFMILHGKKQKSHSCSCKVEKVNPSNCRTSDLSEKYFISIKAEINDCLAL